MKKFYPGLIAILFLAPFTSFGKNDHSDSVVQQQRKGFVTFNLNNSINSNKPVDAAYVILDKYDRTGAGYIRQKFEVADNKIIISDLPEGKYFAEIYTKGLYKQHFSKVIKVSKKGSIYTFTMDEISAYVPKKAIIPQESSDFLNTSIVSIK
ncbi:MAG: hypothetical protein ABI861_04745 [Panacibacter sp.]